MFYTVSKLYSVPVVANSPICHVLHSSKYAPVILLAIRHIMFYAVPKPFDMIMNFPNKYENLLLTFMRINYFVSKS